MAHAKLLIVLILLTINVLACKNEPENKVTSEPLPTTAADSAAATGNQASYILKEKMMLKDGKELVFPKEKDAAAVIFFATPGATIEGKTSLNPEGQMQAGRLTSTLAQAGIAQVYVEGNAAMQTGLGTARANECEFNLFKADEGESILKVILKNFTGKKVMVVGSPEVISGMMNLVTGKTDLTAVTGNSMTVAIAKGLGDAEMHEVSY
ncbi:MAG: hypothetical protein HY842_18540 [Bacteroidetes bacterium]|nr:hypothetical protein [Bacteroidota bacterium]